MFHGSYPTNIGALISRIALLGPLYFADNEDPPK